MIISASLSPSSEWYISPAVADCLQVTAEHKEVIKSYSISHCKIDQAMKAATASAAQPPTHM